MIWLELVQFRVFGGISVRYYKSSYCNLDICFELLIPFLQLHVFTDVLVSGCFLDSIVECTPRVSAFSYSDDFADCSE